MFQSEDPWMAKHSVVFVANEHWEEEEDGGGGGGGGGPCFLLVEIAPRIRFGVENVECKNFDDRCGGRDGREGICLRFSNLTVADANTVERTAGRHGVEKRVRGLSRVGWRYGVKELNLINVQ
ncbi:unnamed protein product [Taenia asiatica]|uniref:Uncharacterized protein n=1 Tax=Taenia asiatica TaxID=60517 RepID=A0A0R3VWB6_TAEAS|nr:unnamed protein product [Taenia asiatica]